MEIVNSATKFVVNKDIVTESDTVRVTKFHAMADFGSDTKREVISRQFMNTDSDTKRSVKKVIRLTTDTSRELTQNGHSAYAYRVALVFYNY